MRNLDSLVDVNGDRLYIRFVEKDQAQPTIVFLHDSLGCVALWRDFPFMLAEATNCNLLVYDRKGYGSSDPFSPIKRTNKYLEDEADTLNSLLAQLEISSAILFGHSDGGSIALIAAAKYPERVKALVSEAAHIFVQQETLDGIEAAVKSYEETDLESRLAKYHGEKTDAIFHAWTDTWLSEAFRSWDITGFLPGVVCPALIIQGDKDEFGTLQQVEGIARRVGGRAEVVIMPGIGHTPHKEASAETAELVQRFITTL
ncbi:alpha/beta fold hydrolase [Flavihumibacter solisilvae]|uniref:Alpha/beta hydrolase n=1 Tax=Flavihumibacter solisilvae TaxID=1349421 RepID=A0A0C1L700_9BACT|nr:alpha/beta hydrolase [Flavihumibacter solisilvae]KIC95927.1 alpha/beta hydrolase [Flavihumibacter solisilvae]